ncbi:MAG: hypothetical protein ABFC96_14780 [Thermoguttaceae bacterium]
MNQTQTTVLSMFLAVAAIIGVGRASAGDVTVVGYAGLAPGYRQQKPAAGEVATPADVAPRYGQEYQSAAGQFDTPGPDGATQIDSPRLLSCEYPNESAWYARFDYYHFGQQDTDKINTNDEDGLLYTVGYGHRVGRERFRLELFGGNATYVQRGPAWGDADSSVTNLGIRGEAEFLWPIEAVGQPPLEFFAGVGTRAWIRDIKDGTALDGSYFVGLQETWWTIYPYIGLEKRWTLGDCFEPFVSGRLGGTAFTFEHDSLLNSPACYPTFDITGQIEAGFRRKSLIVSACFEGFAWGHSESVHSGGGMFYYPASQLTTLGLKVGFAF